MGGLSIIVGCVSLVPGALCLVLRGRSTAAAAVLGHIAATGFLVAAASSDSLAPYTRGLLQKQPDGRISWLSRLAFYPYHTGLYAKLAIQRRRSSEPLYNQVTKQLYIGGWPEHANWLPTGNPSVVDVTCELPRTHARSHYLCLPCWDTQAPNVEQIQQGVEWVQRELAEGQSVYIHCAHGHGRSATVLAAVLIATGQAGSAEEAVTLMRAARPRVRLNRVQAAALRAWIAAKAPSAAAAGGTCAQPPPQLAGGRADVRVLGAAAAESKH